MPKRLRLDRAVHMSSRPRQRTQTLIIGGGLSGLSLAAELARQGQDFVLVEARDRLGGRILTRHHGDTGYDLGPAWFWPGQPRIADLIGQLGLSWFEQHYAGELTYEDEQGRVSRGLGFSSMRGSLRLDGGFGALIDALAASVHPDRVQLSMPIQQIARAEDGVIATAADGWSVHADRVVLALPPRVAAQLSFVPALPDKSLSSMLAVPTWMAGQAKAVAIYASPFWRDAGLSGDAMSRRGPMVEIHDASPAQDGPYALFGFVGLPRQARKDQVRLRQLVLDQLVRLFGPEAAQPLDLFVKDWANDPFTATLEDQQPLFSHPTYGLPSPLMGLWDQALIFAGTEVAPQFGGYVEGALEAAEQAARLIVYQKVEFS